MWNIFQIGFQIDVTLWYSLIWCWKCVWSVKQNPLVKKNELLQEKLYKNKTVIAFSDNDTSIILTPNQNGWHSADHML